MKVLVTGSEGYIGRALMTELRAKGIDAIGVDTGLRETWVQMCGGKYRPWDQSGIKSFRGNIANHDFVKEILSIHKPNCVIHLASQPSMPFSQINGHSAMWTQVNNLSMCVNLLWGMKDIVPGARLIITTTTGIPGQFYKTIPEGSTLNMAGSWYHISRGFDSENCMLASRQWGSDIMELRTAIVYGLTTKSMDRYTTTRFDTDEYFGTALNRFVYQGVKKEPITIYGKGEQVKPFVSLQDCVDSIINAITYNKEYDYEVYNQVTHNISIRELGEMVSDICNVPLNHIPNPRQEKEDWDMTFDNDKFLRLLGRKPTNIKDDIKEMIKRVNQSVVGSEV